MMRNVCTLATVLMGAVLLLAAAGCDKGPVASSPETPVLMPPEGSEPASVMLPESASKKPGNSGVKWGVEVLKLIGPQGGKVKNGPVILDVPAGALAAPVLISVTIPVAGPLVSVFGPSGLEFNAPVKLSVDLDEVLVIGDEANLTWYWFDPSSLSWVDIGAAIDPLPHTLDTEINHFSTYLPGGRASW